MNPIAGIPDDVVDYLREVFRDCNRAVSSQLSYSPSTPEPTLDVSLIAEVERHSAPVVLPSRWFVALRTHFLGGGRHFNGFEVADIAVMLVVRFPGTEYIKTALLQSKRLYPVTGHVRELTRSDFVTGIGSLLDPEDVASSIGRVTEYRFSEESRYRALIYPDSQTNAIAGWEEEVGLQVYYQLYNPWSPSHMQRVPTLGRPQLEGDPPLGVRVAKASEVHGLLASGSAKTPRLDDLDGFARAPRFGWRLEDFICDEVLACHEGNLFEGRTALPVETLLYRRTAPIDAAVLITVESPQYAS